MKKITRYDPAKTYMFPSGVLATPEVVRQQFPAITVFPHIIETDGAEQVLFAIQNLAAMRSAYDIDPALTEDEAIEAISSIVNAPPPQQEISADERIAAALEAQVMMSLPDVE